MRIFVTGASGFVGSAVLPELLANGHTVVGLARSEESAKKVAATGAQVLRGDLTDLESLKRGASESEGVIHLGFIHDFSNFHASIGTDLKAIEMMGTALKGTQRPLVIASGNLGVAPGRLATEKDDFDPKINPRAAGHVALMGFKDQGVRVSSVRLAPTVHDRGDHGFLPTLIDVARAKRLAGYVGDGSNRWNAVHRMDAARLFRLAVEKAPAGSSLHAVAEESLPTRVIAEFIGKHLGVPAGSIAPDKAMEHFGWISRFFAMDQPASSALTQECLGWKPTHAGLFQDLEAHYFG